MSNENPQETAFDRISRILATPMPRRQALKVALSLATSAVAASCLQGASLGASNKKGNVGGKKQPLDYPITDLSLKDVQVYNVIKALEYHYQVPVSFIDASDKTEDTPYNPAKPNAPMQLIAVGHPLLTIDLKAGTARDVLNQLVKQDPSYQYGLVEGRLIVYPKQHKFDTVVSGVDIRDEPRGDAAVKYVFNTLAKRVKGFEDYGTAIGGYGEGPDAPIYKEPVTLNSQGTVLSQLAQLLGSDPSMIFFVIRNSSGETYFSLIRSGRSRLSSHLGVFCQTRRLREDQKGRTTTSHMPLRLQPLTPHAGPQTLFMVRVRVAPHPVVAAVSPTLIL